MDIAVISRYRIAGVRDSNNFLLKALAWAALAALVLVVINLPRPVPINKSLGGYVTTLDGRTRSQRANALRAARRVNGTVIKPGQTFSFNRTVGPWTRDAGYVKAPVSYDGVMVQDWGGGVCQTSTALYNAALIAGLDIPERHRHTRAPRYAPAGRDAAVAPNTADLLIHNPYPWPVRVERLATDSGLGFRFLGAFDGPVAVVETKATPAEEQMESPESIPRSDRTPGHQSRPSVCGSRSHGGSCAVRVRESANSSLRKRIPPPTASSDREAGSPQPRADAAIRAKKRCMRVSSVNSG